MENSNYIYLNGEKIEVSFEVWEDYRQLKDKTHKRNFRHKRCTCPCWQLCELDCFTCRYKMVGDTESLDSIYEDLGDSADEMIDMPASMFTEQVEDSIIIGNLRERLKTLNDEERLICELTAQGYKEREASEIMGLPKTTYHDMKNRLFARLREKWSDLKYF